MKQKHGLELCWWSKLDLIQGKFYYINTIGFRK